MNKAVFFDVDDTLYDHLIPFRKAVYPWTEHIAHFPYEKAYHRMRYYSDMLSLEFGGAGQMEEGDSTDLMRRKRFQLALKEFDVLLTEQEAEQIQQLYLACQFDIECFDGARELILELQQKGYVVGLLTNGAEAHQWKKIRALKLDEIIPLSRIFVSGTYGIDKPDPDIFRLINERIDIPAAQCTYIGDSWRNDVIGACHADWNVIWFNHRELEQEAGITLLGDVKDYAELRAILL